MKPEDEYLRSYRNSEGIFVILVLIIALGLIILGFNLPV